MQDTFFKSRVVKIYSNKRWRRRDFTIKFMGPLEGEKKKCQVESRNHETSPKITRHCTVTVEFLTCKKLFPPFTVGVFTSCRVVWAEFCLPCFRSEKRASICHGDPRALQWNKNEIGKRGREREIKNEWLKGATLVMSLAISRKINGLKLFFLRQFAWQLSTKWRWRFLVLEICPLPRFSNKRFLKKFFSIFVTIDIFCNSILEFLKLSLKLPFLIGEAVTGFSYSIKENWGCALPPSYNVCVIFKKQKKNWFTKKEFIYIDKILSLMDNGGKFQPHTIFVWAQKNSLRVI